MERKKIAIYGGTFDPPHYGHLNVARTVVERGVADEVWLMVSPQNPLKIAQRISPEEKRLEMAELLVHGVNGVRVSDFEFALPRPSYTVDTLHALREAYPEYDFTLLVGTDNLRLISRWRSPEVIIREFGLIVYPRPEEVGFSLKGNDKILTLEIPEELSSRITILEGVPEMEVSSTEIRRRIKEGESTEDLLPRDVATIMQCQKNDL